MSPNFSSQTIWQNLQRLETPVNRFQLRDVPGLGRGVELFVEIVAADLALANLFKKRFKLGAVAFGIRLIANLARLLVADIAIPGRGANDRHHVDLEIEVPQPLQRRGPELRVAVFEFRVQRVPEVLDEPLDHVQRITELAEALFPQVGFGRAARPVAGPWSSSPGTLRPAS
jgi:hypothetical protein